MDAGVWGIYPMQLSQGKMGTSVFAIHPLSSIVFVFYVKPKEELAVAFWLQLEQFFHQLKLPAAFFEWYQQKYGDEYLEVNDDGNLFSLMLNRVLPFLYKPSKLPRTFEACFAISLQYNFTKWTTNHKQKTPLDFWHDLARENNIKLPVYPHFKFEIELLNVIPKVKRTVSFPGWFPFDKFTEFINLLIGWKSIHLYEYQSKGLLIEMSDSPNDLIAERDARKGVIRYAADEITLGDVFNEEQKEIHYLYDFGDEWKHTIKFLEIIEDVNPVRYPKPEKMRGECPPENCGGPFMYNEIRKEYNYYGESEIMPGYRPKSLDVSRIKTIISNHWQDFHASYFMSGIGSNK